MKRALRAALATAGSVGLVWKLFEVLDVVSRCFAEPLHRAEMARRSAADAEVVKRLSPTLTVLHGPFAGMRYAHARAAGSALVPKILGSYERELQALIEASLDKPYSDIVDIGCAEGYYAIGLAKSMPNVRVHAFDTDVDARRLCADMAAVNGVADRVAVESLCDEEALLGLSLGARALVISDCEGYEAVLFTPRVAAHLARHDVLIEVHDRTDPGLGNRLRECFRQTHDHIVIDSVDDARKLRTYEFRELEPFDLATRRRLLSEGRGMVMEWLFFTARIEDAKSEPTRHMRLVVAA